MIYDDVLNITWLQNWNLAAGTAFDNGSSSTDGRMTWDSAVVWANNLVYGGFDDWRLPTTDTGPSSNCRDSFDPGGGYPMQYYGYNCTGGELGYMFYKYLGINGNGDGVLDATGDTVEEIANLALFPEIANLAMSTNVQYFSYWYGTQYAPDPSIAWTFDANNGGQFATGKSGGGNEFFAVAVRAGDVFDPGSFQVPEPGPLALIGLGLAGLAFTRRRKHKNRTLMNSVVAAVCRPNIFMALPIRQA